MNPSNKPAQLSNLERGLLWVPMLAGLVFGILPFFMGGGFGRMVGYIGNDVFIYRLAGAATLGYGIAYIVGMRGSDWGALRLIVIATLTFNLASLFACVMEMLNGTSNWFSYLITGASVALVAITAWVLNGHKSDARPAADVSRGTIRGLWLGVVLSGLFGLLPLLVPVMLAQLVGYKGTDVFIIRQAGAASLGYAVMALFGIRSGAWQEVRLPMVMALVFNAFSFIAAVLALINRDPLFIVLLIGAAGLFVTISTSLTLQHQGK